MDIDQFFEALAATPREWELCGGGAIRRRGWGQNGACPLTAVHHYLYPDRSIIPDRDYSDAAGELGIGPSASTIAAAADGYGGPTREKLLRACGLV